MFRWVVKKAGFATHRARLSRVIPEHAETCAGEEDGASSPEKFVPVLASLDENLTFMQSALNKTEGVLFRRFMTGTSAKRSALLVAVPEIVDKKILNEFVLGPLMKTDLPEGEDGIRYLQESVLSVTEVKETETLNQAINQIMQGDAALFIEGECKALLVSAGEWKSRAIEQPLTETVIRGPRDSFVEDVQTNLSLLRRRIHHPKLRLEGMSVGKVSQTKIILVYIEGIADEGIVREAKRRVSSIQVDAILESGYIEQYIEDAPFSLFPTIANTEKPDIAAARILEGRVAIFVDGTPLVLTVPDLLISHFQVSEDYYSRPFYTSVVRLLRILSFFTTIMLPGLFLAIQYYHPVLIPYSLLVSLARAREGVPFQLYLEVILMILVFEVIREAGIRMPKPIGQAVSIVGAIILGQSAVEAGLVGLPVVVVVAFAGISTFLIHSLVEPISLLRILFSIAGATLGIFGILLLGMAVVTHLATLRSFGVPYAAPLFPIEWRDWRDSLFRFPLRYLWHRPESLKPANFRRLEQEGLAGAKNRK